jgi:hypothetical protein
MPNAHAEIAAFPPFIAHPVGLLDGEELGVRLEPGDLVHTTGPKDFGLMHRGWCESPQGHSLNGSAWRVFNLIVVHATPSLRFPWRVAAFTDTDLAKSLPYLHRATVTKARHKLVEVGFVRTHKLHRAGFLWILQTPPERFSCL